MTKLFLYTSEKCVPCAAMKDALGALEVKYTEIKLRNGMILPPDVRSVPTLAIEKDGRRTTVCVGWPGSVDRLERMLRENGIPVKKGGHS
jgi:glutaredoxin